MGYPGAPSVQPQHLNYPQGVPAPQPTFPVTQPTSPGVPNVQPATPLPQPATPLPQPDTPLPQQAAPPVQHASDSNIVAGSTPPKTSTRDNSVPILDYQSGKDASSWGYWEPVSFLN